MKPAPLPSLDGRDDGGSDHAHMGNNFAHTVRSGAAFVPLMFSSGCSANMVCASTDLTANRDLDSQIGCKSP